ncbi:MAG: DNA polymerase III subunit alpha [Paludibacteraceae bacterium]|nr:DNA polymerase III subunit alpha [Paludibacteraceae bacterium]
MFTHLHVHSHYSILDGMSKVPDLINRARELGMNSLALTDHGVMYGIKEFLDCANSVNSGIDKQIKQFQQHLSNPDTPPDTIPELQQQLQQLQSSFFTPIVGVEAYCARRSMRLRSLKEDASGNHLILLAKNKAGYHTLCRLVSTSWLEGYYYKPRIDKELISQLHDGLIVSSACLAGEVPQKILAGKIQEAEDAVKWWKDLMGDDYYLEIQRHQTNIPDADHRVFQEQQLVIPHILELGAKLGVKVIATNDSHFTRQDEGTAHDRLICLSTGKTVDDLNRMHYTQQEWLKSEDEMRAIFADCPEVLENTQLVAQKVERYNINSGPIMPKFDIPEDFGTEQQYRQQISHQQLFDEFTQNEKGETILSQEQAEKKIHDLGGYDKIYRIKLEADYLKQLTWQGALMRYGVSESPLTPLVKGSDGILRDEQAANEIRERINFELHVMKTMGFPGYFLIVCDYIRAAREQLDVSVGPGRGSAAGSVVAYCLRITDVDPLKYDLLFERFLNPDRISLPDIDVDFDDQGRARVLDYVSEKYGKTHVAHIITYGQMATKNSIADMGRVQNVPLSTVNAFKNLIPDKFPDNLKDSRGKKLKVNIKNCLAYAPAFIEKYKESDLTTRHSIDYAKQLEGTIRQIGVHACGVIIGADSLDTFAPLATVKDKETDEDIIVTQYDGHVIEQVGLIKMDFLGLITLSIIKETLRNIKQRTGELLDIDHIPLDDTETFQLFSRGDTIAVFQFESPGMQKYLRELQPTVFTDLIAMNALYRPGPMDYIPHFIKRKHGLEPITYDIPVMEKYLKDTYGVTVYQEQVMLLSRLLADFTRGESDQLRKAMGKKQIAVLEKLKPKFFMGGEKNGHPLPMLEKIWADWEKFAEYAFNKSHATCYAWVAYQTAFLKAHYPNEFMAANLTISKDKIEEVTKLMTECKRMGIKVLEPDVNESGMDFTVNAEGNIRFGLGGIKGVGASAVESILACRSKDGFFTDIYNFLERVNLQSCNRKTLESLGLAGAFDSLPNGYRELYFQRDNGKIAFNEILLAYGQEYQANKASRTNSLFEDSGLDDVRHPPIREAERWSTLEKLSLEKNVVGIYLSQHPLDDFRVEMNCLCNYKCKDIDNIVGEVEYTGPESPWQRSFCIAGIVTEARQGVISKKGNEYGDFTIEDYNGSHHFVLFGDNYINFKQYLFVNYYLIVRGTFRGKNDKWRREPIKIGEKLQLSAEIENISLLPDICKKLVGTLSLTINLQLLDKSFVDTFVSLLQKASQPDENGRPPHTALEVTVKTESRSFPLRSSLPPINIDVPIKNFIIEQNKLGIITDYRLKR